MKTIQKACPEDKPDIYRLFCEMLRDIYGKDAPHYDDSFLDKYFSGGADLILLAKEGEKTVAFLSIEEHREEYHYLYLDDFCVQEDFRGQGIGTELLKQAEAIAAARKIGLIVLHVERSNKRAARLYASLGYEEFGASDSRIRMIKRL
ncbi:MAG: GNAT family N-acetyltransferase [Oscillospiraceae bacterium]|nr:GNAT family N-acetyltransferase [Oscillospiraceae bacterium]